MTELPVTMEPDNWMQKTGGYAKDMTLRQYIAIEAMKGLCAGFSSTPADNWPDDSTEDYEVLALHSKNIADAMLKALND
mgnify:CR=1 FL=1